VGSAIANLLDVDRQQRQPTSALGSHTDNENNILTNGKHRSRYDYNKLLPSSHRSPNISILFAWSPFPSAHLCQQRRDRLPLFIGSWHHPTSAYQTLTAFPLCLRFSHPRSGRCIDPKPKCIPLAEMFSQEPEHSQSQSAFPEAIRTTKRLS